MTTSIEPTQTQVDLDDLIAEIIEPLAAELSRLADNQAVHSSATSWQMAHTYVQAIKTLKGIDPEITQNKINKQVRTRPGYKGPGAEWLSNAIKIDRIWSGFIERVMVNHNSFIAYDDVRRIANCGLSQEQKDALLTWIQSEKVTQAELRARINHEKDGQIGTVRPDFDLQLSNHWNLEYASAYNGFDGGISPHLIANLLYYFTDPGDVVIDPMAGGDNTYKVVQHYRFFSDPEYSGDFGGVRHVHRADIQPSSPEIQQADVTKVLPWPDDFADFCLLDPPYYGMANGKYPDFGRTIEEWEVNLEAAVRNVVRVLKPGGFLAVIVDDYLRANEFQPLAALVFQILENVGLHPQGTIYDHYRNYVMTMNALAMWRAKRARLMVNGMKIIHVFQK